MENRTPVSVLKNSLLACVGLLFFGFGIYLTIQANIGAAPWDSFSLGLSSVLGIKFGNAAVMISFLVLLVDILLREKIGIGMLLDAILVGKTVDLLNFLDLVKPQQSPLSGALCMIAGMAVCGFAQAIYMRAALGCGPRDALLVGLSRRLSRLPIGGVSIGIQATVAVIGWLLGGSIGLGTLLFALLQGPIMELVFRLVRFDAKAVRHQDLPESLRVLSGRVLEERV